MPDIDASMKINVVDNKMRVTASFEPAQGEGKIITPEVVIEKLSSMDIKTGIKHDNINKMCNENIPRNSLILAEGITPSVGDKARLEMYVKLPPRKAVERENGGVDFYDLGEIPSAEVGDELYRKIPPTKGTSGKNVFGEEIEGIYGRDLTIILGRGTAVDDKDENLVRATKNGVIQIKNNILHISEIYTVKGDVDFSTGNLNFNGSIKIGGTVKAGFEVRAKGFVEIKGFVEDAQVIADGDVIVKKGFVGSGSGLIMSGQDVYVKYVENQHIEADRDIIINGEAYHATILSCRSVYTQGKKGAIVGGQCIAKKNIEAHYFGSVATPLTIIKIGVDPKLEENLKKVEDVIAISQEALNKIEQNVAFLNRQKINSNGILPPEKQIIYDKLEKTKKTLPAKLEDLQQTRKELLIEQKNLDEVNAVADKGVYPKVQVHIGNQRIIIYDKLGPSRFRLFKKEIIRTTL